MADALEAMKSPDAQAIAGGQSLLPMMKQRFAAPGTIVDLQSLGLSGVRREGTTIVVGAMTRHDVVATDPLVRTQLPGLALLASRIGDRQVRARGTIGGSLANNDPNACYPAAILALGATVRTDRREIPADAFFAGLYTTVLLPGEIILEVVFPRARAGHYEKLPHPASRFAMVGVFLAHGPSGIRVAVTGAAQTGVFRWHAAEERLAEQWSPNVDDIPLASENLCADLHGSAAYRASLAHTLLSRAVKAIKVPPQEIETMKMTGERLIGAPRETVWRGLNDPRVLQTAIPGCESLEGTVGQGMDATTKIRIGPISARFTGRVMFTDVNPANGYVMSGEGQGGGAGFAKGRAGVKLEDAEGGTVLRYWVEADVGGKIAQLGGRLIDATAKKMADQFFSRFAAEVENGESPAIPNSVSWEDSAPVPDNATTRLRHRSELKIVSLVAIVAMVAIFAMTAAFLFGRY